MEITRTKSTSIWQTHTKAETQYM